jgi:hypothetical protein
MKTKAKIILKSLTDLPAATLTIVASAPERALDASRPVLALPMQLTRGQLRATHHATAESPDTLTARAMTPLRVPQPWMRGGLNE